jgi:hypothetical protein
VRSGLKTPHLHASRTALLLVAFDGERIPFSWKDYAHWQQAEEDDPGSRSFCAASSSTFNRRASFGSGNPDSSQTPDGPPCWRSPGSFFATTPEPTEACPTGTPKSSTWQCSHCLGTSVQGFPVSFAISGKQYMMGLNLAH